MNNECSVVRDLLPLYADDVCSAASREFVEKHLPECPECTAELEKLRSHEIENDLQNERTQVIEYQAKRFKRRSTAAGAVVAGIFMIPILVCLIVTMARGMNLGAFFIVLGGLAVAASLTVVPLTVPEDKLFWTFCAFCASLMILLAVTCIYSGGDWFFVAASASLFGLSVFFLPFVIKAKPLQKYLPERKALTVIAVDVALFAIMMECISIRNNGLGFWRTAALIGIVIGLAVSVVIPELKKRGIIK